MPANVPESGTAPASIKAQMSFDDLHQRRLRLDHRSFAHLLPLHGPGAATWRGSSMLCGMVNWGSLLRQAAKIGLDLLSSSRKAPAGGARDGGAPPAARPQARSAPSGERAGEIVYAPDLDGSADPGEVVWAWVPFEKDDGRGKDRPLLVVGRRSGDLVGLMLSSRQDRADDRDWVSIGSGEWDRAGRESFVRLDRVLEVGEHDIRREGAVLDRDRFERVAGQLRGRFGWS